MKTMKTTVYLFLFVTLFIGGNLNLQAAVSAQKTIANLQNAYIGESTASAKYAAFAKKAREEGHSRIGLLFEAASKAESIHAGNHKAVLQQLGGNIPKLDLQIDAKSTAENLEDALNGESYEINTMYPDFIKTAQAENASLALISLNYAYQTEKKHKTLYAQAIQSLKEGKDQSLPGLYSVCSTCGNTYDSASPERCGISMTPQDRFIKFSI